MTVQYLHPVQFSIQLGQPHENHKTVLDLLSKNPPKENSLICLPELFSTGFITHPDKLKGLDPDQIYQEDCQFLAQLAKTYHCHILGASLEFKKKFQNLSLYFTSTGELKNTYQKIHPFSFSGEDQTYEAGSKLSTFPWEGFTVQQVICYDLRFPELFRAGIDRSVNLYIIQANWPASRQEHWKILLKARAIENQAYVLGVNSVGQQGKLNYVGGSCLYNPTGEEMFYLENESFSKSLEVKPLHVEEWRKKFPVLRDKKPPNFWN